MVLRFINAVKISYNKKALRLEDIMISTFRSSRLSFIYLWIYLHTLWRKVIRKVSSSGEALRNQSMYVNVNYFHAVDLRNKSFVVLDLCKLHHAFIYSQSDERWNKIERYWLQAWKVDPMKRGLDILSACMKIESQELDIMTSNYMGTFCI